MFDYTAGKMLLFLDLSVSQYSLVGGPFCINLSRIALLFKHNPSQLNIGVFIFFLPSNEDSGGEVEEKLSITVFVENKRTV